MSASSAYWPLNRGDNNRWTLVGTAKRWPRPLNRGLISHSFLQLFRDSDHQPLKADVTWDDSQRWFFAQHRVAMLEQCCNRSKQCRNNVEMMCCVKNRRCKSSKFQRSVALWDSCRTSSVHWPYELFKNIRQTLYNHSYFGDLKTTKLQQQKSKTDYLSVRNEQHWPSFWVYPKNSVH